jgi:hypothetical protein
LRRLLASLTVALLLSGLFTAVASAGGEKEQIVESQLTFSPGEESALVISCRQGFKAVTGVVVRADPGISIYYGFEETGAGGGSQWVFRVKNRGDRPGVVRAKVRCVKVFEPRGEDTYSFDLTERTRIDFEEVERLLARCPAGDAPLGWGFLESAPGGRRNDPPAAGAGTRLFQVQPQPGGFLFGVQGAGLEPVDVQFRAICIDRNAQNRQVEIDNEVARRTFSVNVGATDGTERNLRCGSARVAGAAGWSLPARESIFAGLIDVFPGGSRLSTFNADLTSQEARYFQLCLEQEIRRR